MKKSIVFLLSFTFAVICNLGINSEGSTKASIIYEGDYVTKAESINADDVTQTTEKELYQVAIELDYEKFSLDKDTNFIEDNVDDYLRMIKDAGKDHHATYNNQYVTELKLESKQNIRVSQYAPFIYYTEDMAYDALLPSLEELSTKQGVSNIYVSKVNESDVTSESYTPFYDVNAETVINEGIYDGTNVVVGIIDSGIIDVDDQNFVGQDIEVRNESWYLESVSAHATRVGAFISGKYGLAPNAKTLSVEYAGPDIQGETDWLIDRNVNVINISIADSAGDAGEYSSNAKYIDYITRRYWITFVGSAGNLGELGDEDALISSPKTAANIITVGSSKNKYHVSDFSSYVYINKFFDKPTLVAPGEDVTLPDGTTTTYSGTSYSSAIVAGAVTLLMDKSSSLKSYPEKVLSIVTASATMDRLSLYHSTYEDSGLEVRAGAGLLDVEEALNSTSTTYSFSIGDNTGAYDFVYTKQVYLIQGQTFRVSLAWLKNVEKTSTGYDDHVLTDYDLKLYRSGMNLAQSIGSFDNNIELYEHYVKETGYYEIKVKQWGDRQTNMRDYLSITYTID
ncbi:S8 family peptidase [Haloplasma contractile]|uniref:Peptidase S8/S53 domain-containing protein n=1 Tax=Haloplasma contractile SSD-17B TaxID=1033810 RepID=U2EDI1_9MOLU|nr:S8/S53 family peptidase [Haloplasma contractile]ERJ13038.1 Prepro-subtilisin sendai putative protein [Haloplasma contractile SSD-17B]